MSLIETLGQSPINSAVTTGLSEFVSLLRRRPSKAGMEDPNRYARPYTSTRGLLINKEFVEGVVTPDLNLGYRFQFNPQTVSDVKTTSYESRQYAGLHYTDYIWGGGGERIISFQLFLDNTPQSKHKSFRPEAYGSTLANEIKYKGKAGYTYDENTGKYTLDGRYFGKSLVDESVALGKSLKESLVPSKGPKNFEYTGDAYSNSRVNERGILPEVELIQSFLYPAPLSGEETPKFAEGGVINTTQFRPPATAVLVLGPLYLEGVIKSAPVNYTLFDQDLTPIRGTIDIEFAVFEFENVERFDEVGANAYKHLMAFL